MLGAVFIIGGTVLIISHELATGLTGVFLGMATVIGCFQRLGKN
jgi:hypothetical protein